MNVTTYLKPEFLWEGTIQKIQEMSDGKTVRIKGIAAHAGETSKNGRHYMRDALIRAVTSFIGKPVSINHAPLTPEEAKETGVKFDPNLIVGNVEEMDFDEKTGTLNYVADVKKEPYVTLLRQGSPEISGVSIQADYLRDKCPTCGKTGFENREAFETHMTKEHYQRNIKAGPWGIIGRALSLVFGRQTPGLSTTIQLAESKIKGFDSLKETVEQIETERENMSKIGIRKEDHIAVGKTGVITEKTVAEPKPQQPKKHVTDKEVEEYAKSLKEQQFEGGFEGCVAKMESEGYDTDSAHKICGKINAQGPRNYPGRETLQIKEPCSPELKACVDDLIAAGHPESSAWAICKSKLGETLMLKALPLMEKPSLVEQQGLTFDQWRKEGYMEETSAACVKETRITNENNQKIAKFMDAVTEALNVLFANATEAYNDVLGRIQTMPADDLGWKKAFESLPKDDTSWKEHIGNHPKDDLGWKELKMPDLAPIEKKIEEMKKIITELVTTIEKKIAEIKIPDLAPLEKKVSEIKVPDLEPIHKEIALLKDTKPLDERFKKLEETIAAKTKDFETILATADKNIVEVTKSVEEWRKKAEALEAKQKEQEANKVKETTDLNAKVDALKTDTDNLKDKLKPQFKGQTKEQTGKKDPGASNWKP